MQEEWTEKYRPRSLSEIMGNETAIRSMRRWAESWSKGAPRYKAMVLRGEPGTGKTSSALALANDFGWDIVEMNASDHRNAESIRRVAGLGAISQTLTLDGEFHSTAQGRRKLIVLDEADNLFGREDYGGAKAIVEVIRGSSQPVILIVNDYYELTRKASALKSLSDKAIFRRLEKRTVTAVLARITKAEGVSLGQSSLDKIADNAGGDLRAAVNDLQMLVEGRTEVCEEHTSVLSERNQEAQLGDSLRAMFGARTAKEAHNATLDLDKLPDELEKWVEESIPSEMKDPRDLAAAFDALSRSDIYLRRSRKLQHYGMWAYARMMMTGGVALARSHGARPYVGDYGFPSHFIVMSRAKGANAARESIRAKLSPVFHTSGKEFNEAILPPLATLARREKGILVKLAVESDLDDGDVAYLLGSEPGAADVEDVMAKVRAARGDGDAGRAAKARPGKRTKGLGDF